MGDDGLVTEADDATGLRLAGEYAKDIPLPKTLAQVLFLCQGRGIPISSDGQLLEAGACRITADRLLLTQEVRNLRIWLDDVVWEWDSAGQAWLQHKVYREDT
jgi:hypothetical protein